MSLLFKDISYANGLFNMDADPDPAVAMKASGFYTSSKIPYLDTQLVRNYADAKRLKKVPILYHFAGGADPLTEANYFFQALSPLEVGDIPALDFEIDVADNVAWVRIFVQRIHDLTGCYPWVYIDRSRRQAHDWSSVFNNCAEWIAAPDVSFDANIPGVGVYMAQQGPIVNGVDTDEYFGTLESLANYGYKTAPTPTPAPVPEPTPAPVSPPPPVVAPSPPVVVSPPAPEVPPTPEAPSPLPEAPGPVVAPYPIDSQNISWLVRAVKAILRFFHIKVSK